MPYFENKGDYLLMTPSGDYSLQSYRDALTNAAAFCKEYKLKKILADIRNIKGNIPVPDRFLLGAEMARMFGYSIQVAILAPPEIIDRVGENAAVNRGGRVFVTDDLQAALKWLESERPVTHAENQEMDE